MREQGGKIPSCTTGNFVRRVGERKPAPSVVELIEPLLALVQGIDTQLGNTDEQLAVLCAQEPIVALLTTTPGVGTVIAASFISVVDEAKRFHRAHQLESYVGLVPNEDTSGGKRRLGAISKEGNSYLRSLLVQAAWTIVRRSDKNDPLYLWAKKLEQRRGKRIPIVVDARASATLLHALTSALTASNIQQKRSFLIDRLDQKIGAAALTIRDEPRLQGGAGSRWFDVDGFASEPSCPIEEGMLK